MCAFYQPHGRLERAGASVDFEKLTKDLKVPDCQDDFFATSLNSAGAVSASDRSRSLRVWRNAAAGDQKTSRTDHKIEGLLEEVR